MKILETNNDEKLQSVIIGLLLNLTHLDGYNYEVYIYFTEIIYNYILL